LSNPADRPSWDDYFLGITDLVSQRSTCGRRKVGAILVKDRRILATGYNGAPAGLAHCDETGCIRQQLNVPSGERHELCRGLHAEQNAIIQAALYGTSIAGATLYCTCTPCVVCAKMIINAGIREAIHTGGYPDELALQMLQEAGVKVVSRSRKEGEEQ
jgi:dCMP deaminase